MVTIVYNPHFIALDNPPRAASFVTEIKAKIVEVGKRPGSFQKRDDLHKGLRHARHGRYLIFSSRKVMKFGLCG